MSYLFDKKWFADKQEFLLWLLNTPIIRIWFRHIMRIDCTKKVVLILPNTYWIYEGDKIKADFRAHNKFSKRLYYDFYPLWWTFHQWDMLIANPFRPAWNLGFDTLTVYPDPNVEVTSVDGTADRVGVDEILGTIR